MSRARSLHEDAEPPRGLPLDPEGDGTALRRATRQPVRGRLDTPHPSEPRCSATLAGRQCQLYDQHDGMHRHVDKRIDLDATWDSPPWRFDVPEVPAHVTAFKSRTGVVWVRGLIGPRRQQWAIWSDDPHAWQSAEWFDLDRLIALVPLVECPDPRVAS